MKALNSDPEFIPRKKQIAEDVMPSDYAGVLRSTLRTDSVDVLRGWHGNVTAQLQWLIDEGYLGPFRK